MKAKPGSPGGQPKEEAKAEAEFPEEDEETRLYRLKIEEQKRLREEILKQKELRRQQQAGARKKELLERLAQQQQLCAPAAPPEREEQPAAPSPLPTNGNPLLPFPGAPVRQSVKNRLLVKSQDAAPSDLQPKTPGFVPSGASMPYPGQAVRPLKHLRHKVLQVQPADGDAPPPAQTARGTSLQGRPPDAKPCAKRTVMHRANSGGGDGPHISSKVRVIKLSGGVPMHGRGRGAAGPLGRGRPMPNKQNLRVVECKPQPCVVSVEGLSSSTTDAQLRGLLTSVGPIQSLQMLPQQRKAIAKFKEPAHALAFQQKFHRHMVDLSHINVALVVE